MRNLLILSSLFVFAVFQSGAQDVVTANRALGPFHSINVASGIDAELVLSKEESIEIELKGAESGQMITEVEDGILSVRMRTGSYKNATLKVRIHFKELKGIEATGRAEVWSQEDLYEDNLDIKLFNGGATRLTLYCDNLSVNLSQGSILTLRGEGKEADLKVNTNATYNGYEFKCENVIVNATSTGKAKVSVSNTLTASASTGGFVGFVGNPKRVERNVSLRGEITETFLDE